MTQHKHAEVLRAIADGVPLSEFEFKFDGQWDSVEKRPEWLVDEECVIRRKPQYIMINGFKVPEPLYVEPEPGGTYYLASVNAEKLFFEMTLLCSSLDELWLSRGLCHTTEEAAIAHTKAMLGINPEETK